MFVCGECGRRYDRPGYCADGRPLAATDDPLLGTELGRYRLARLIGEGGMGHVYLGVHPTIGSRVAIKVLAAHCAEKPDLVERFFAEARAVNLIRHENIVSVVDMATLDDGRPYIVMEYVEGQTLGALGKSPPAGRLPLGGIVQVFGEVLSALAAAHAIGIVHRDLKPDNILVTAEGHAKVLDFGIAKLAPGLSHLSPRTRTGALLGTPAYMAPEQISGSGPIDPRTDIYSVGVVLYEAVTGKLPFEGETLFDLMRQHLEEPPVPASRARPELPSGFEQVIATALAKAPRDRFQTATEMALALDDAARGLPAHEWRALSRGAVITGGAQSVTRSGRRTAPPPAVTRRDPDPAPTVRASTQSPPRGRLIAGLVATAVVASLATVLVVWKLRTRDDDAAVAPPVPDVGGPIVAGSGSAADHGVYIGSNVQLGPNVIIGSAHAKQATATGSAAPRELDRKVDYAPKRFDPLAYLPKAKAIARQLLPDADFSELQFYENVQPDGHVDLTLPSESESYFEFRSPSRSKAAKQDTTEVGCYVMVYITPTGAEARIRDDDECDHPIRPPPRCTLAEVWQAAIALGEKADAPATIAFLPDGAWFFDLDHANRREDTEVHTIADCH
ncbi:MAG TPA: serine/threonine-protein kinase [Kofleriaceae bacterium]|nr:serine/threonine-protein kinase [Kofleriaceae bacterium]